MFTIWKLPSMPGKDILPSARKDSVFLTDFSCDGTVCFSYAAGNIRMDKHLALLRESNTVAISYTITNQGEEAGLSITPLMNFPGSTVHRLPFLTCSLPVSQTKWAVSL